MLVNQRECNRAYFYHFFELNKVIWKRKPHGVLFKLFSDSLNMKRLPSDLAIFMLAKVFEVMHPPSDSLTLFQSRWTMVRKRHWESSLLSVFPNSIILKNLWVFFLWTHKGYTKNEPLGVSFNLFSDSLNMKILLSDLVLFMLVKVFEENVWWAIVYHFFGLVELIYEKGTKRVLFKCFSDSQNMKKPRVFYLWTR